MSRRGGISGLDAHMRNASSFYNAYKRRVSAASKNITIAPVSVKIGNTVDVDAHVVLLYYDPHTQTTIIYDPNGDTEGIPVSYYLPVKGNKASALAINAMQKFSMEDPRYINLSAAQGSTSQAVLGVNIGVCSILVSVFGQFLIEYFAGRAFTETSVRELVNAVGGVHAKKAKLVAFMTQEIKKVDPVIGTRFAEVA